MIWRLVAIFACCIALCAPATASAKWLKAETQHFILYSDGSETILRDMAVKLEDYRDLLKLLTGSIAADADEAKLEIYLVGSLGPMREMRGLPPEVAGFYSATPEAITAFSQRSNTPGLDRDDTLFHEYAHHFMMQYHATAYPAWYVEGFAEYMMTAEFKKKTIEFGGINLGRAYSLRMGAWMPMRKILSSDTAKMKGQQGAMFYAESWLAVHYLFRTPGKLEALQKFLVAQAKGEGREAAFKQAFGSDYDGFDKDLQHYMAGKITYSVMTRKSDRTAIPVAVSPLPAPYDDLLPLRAMLRLGVGKEKGSALLGRVRAAAASYEEDEFARKTLARAELTLGDRKAGKAILDKQLAADPADAELLYLRGNAELLDCRDKEARECAAARPWFVKAFKINSQMVPNLIAYVQCYPVDALPDNVLGVLLRAHELAPQVDEISVNAAVALMHRGRFADAERLLVPVVADAHGSPSTALVRLLDDARQHRVPTASEARGEDEGSASKNEKGGPAGPPLLSADIPRDQRE